MVAQIDVSGSILDENGEPLIGASVIVQGTTKGTVTDIDSNFGLAADNAEQVLLKPFMIGQKGCICSVGIWIKEKVLVHQFVINSLYFSPVNFYFRGLTKKSL